MFAREQKIEYDPSQPALVERPLASGRPLSTQVQGNAFGGHGLPALRQENSQPTLLASTSKENGAEPDKLFIQPNSVAPLSPSKYNTSPAKSSLSKRAGMNARNSVFDPENAIWSDEEDVSFEHKLPEGRGLHRRGKSVTFDQAPPQVNEYEMTTPDPSSVASGSREGSYDSTGEDEEVSFERGSSFDREDSFDASLEDTEKTPVVLPEDWRFMSPDTANTDLAEDEEDMFSADYGSPAPNAHPGLVETRQHQTSINSVDSNGQPRPLPPLPGRQLSAMSQSGSENSLSGTVERISANQRSLPSPPKVASVSKSDIRRMSGGSLSLEDRLRLMMVQDQTQEKSEAELQRERRMRRAGSKDPSPFQEASSDVQARDFASLNQDNLPTSKIVAMAPRISRESILRRLQSQSDLNPGDLEDESSISGVHIDSSLHLDPDVPIPSLEDPTQARGTVLEQNIVIKAEVTDETDLYSIPDLYNNHERLSSQDDDDDETSQYSQPSLHEARFSLDERQDTPRAQSPLREPEKGQHQTGRVSLPEFTDFGGNGGLDLGLGSYLATSVVPKAPSTLANEKALPTVPGILLEREKLPDLAALRATLQRPVTPEDQLQQPDYISHADRSPAPGTPDSVIHHPVATSPSPEFVATEATQRPSAQGYGQGPPIPERKHRRQSFSQSQLSNENEPSKTGPREGEERRVSSLVQLEIPRDQSDETLGFGLEKEFDRVVEAQKVAFELSLSKLHHPFHGRFPPSEVPTSEELTKPDIAKSILRDIPHLKPQGARALPGDLRARGHHYPTDGSHFANRSPERQRGYLMRQNTKVVIASTDINEETKLTGGASESGQVQGHVITSPRKISQPTWTAEPWNGKSRRKSIRGVDKSPRKKPTDGPAPPLPGQASAVQEGLGAVQEDELAEEEAEDFEEGTERGRLFVKVVGVKDLDLPLPQGETDEIFANGQC
jgi:hypothetical protein